MDDLSTLATEPFCYLTTTGRGSGRPHTIELWFALHDARVYLLSGGGERSDWVKNLQREPAARPPCLWPSTWSIAQGLTSNSSDRVAMIRPVQGLSDGIYLYQIQRWMTLHR